MPIVAHERATEIPWRPGYRTFALAGPDQGVSCVASYNIIEPGSGAPLHYHNEVDEILIVVEGTLELRLGDTTHLVARDHTVSIPARTPHAFTAVGPSPVKMILFVPQSGAIATATTYLEGAAPAGAAQH